MPRSSRAFRIRRGFLFLGAVLLLAGCAHLKRVSQDDPEAIWLRAWEAADDGQPFAAQAKATLDSPKFVQSANLLWRQEGERVRLDLSGFLGLPLASACLTGDRAWLNVPLRALRLNGTVAMLDSAARGSAGLELQHALSILLGRPPRKDGRYETSRDQNGNYNYLFAQGDSATIYRLDPELGRITGYRLEISGRPEYSVEYGDWRLVGDGFRPFSVELAYYREQAALSIKYSSIGREQSFPDDVWEQP